MNEVAEKTLEKMYSEYSSIGVNDWQSISTPVGKQLASIGLVTENVLGEFKLTNAGIAYMER